MITILNTLTTKSATANLAQAAATYDLLTASGDLQIINISFVVVTAGTAFTSVAFVNDETNAATFLSAGNGALANIIAGANLVPFVGPSYLRSGKKIRFTLVGTTGTGSIKVGVLYAPIDAGAALS